MVLLCLDIGSGTQDILLLNTAQTAENAIQLILPALTVLVAQRIAAATARGDSIVLVGETMGGGACSGALRKHLSAGLKAYATPEAARTFSYDLDKVSSWGVKFLSVDEVNSLSSGTTIKLGDVDLETLERALSCWGIKLSPDVVAVAVLDHGAAPRGESNRRFRFRQLEHLLRKDSSLESMVFVPAELPDHLTRMHAIVHTIAGKFPLVLMDTGGAAVFGAPLDKVVGVHHECLAVNLGNSHTLAFHLEGTRVLGLFEHHTSSLSLSRLEALLGKLVSGELDSNEVWEEGGHGSLVLEKGGSPFIAATGPRRSLIAPSWLEPYFAAPFGSMMLVGCFGLARAAATKLPQWREELERALLLN